MSPSVRDWTAVSLLGDNAPMRWSAPCAGTIALAAACGGSQSAAPAPVAPSDVAPASLTPTAPVSMPIDTGKDCAKAEVRCGGGDCDAKVKNDCEAAVSCALKITATCETENGGVEAKGAERGSIAAHETGDVGAQAGCPGRALHTEVETLVCK
jgi:hypothetical protein